MSEKKQSFDQRLDTEKGLTEYQAVADAVGFVPSLRVKDNVIQAITVGVGFVLGAGAGAIVAVSNKGEWYFGAMIGAVLGLVVFTLISGAVIMVLGWVRAAKKLK